VGIGVGVGVGQERRAAAPRLTAAPVRGGGRLGANFKPY
jgi:hypothetical protein